MCVATPIQDKIEARISVFLLHRGTNNVAGVPVYKVHKYKKKRKCGSLLARLSDQAIMVSWFPGASQSTRLITPEIVSRDTSD